MPKMSSGQFLIEFQKTGVLTGDTKNDGQEHVAYCPNCEDPEQSSSPSASFNFQKMKFYCFSCKKNFSFKELLSMAKEDATERRKAANKDRSKKKSNLSEEPLPSISQLERWQAALWANNTVLQAFKDKRGISNSTIEKFGIGYRADKKRYTIPIYDMQGHLVNVRYYGITSKAKMINHPGYGEARLVGFDALKGDEILLVEGEGDWLTSRDKGFNSMTWTSGVASWQERWSMLFEGKTVFLCFDDDEAGRLGARRVALSLDRAGAKVHIIQLSIPNIKGGDLTDYFHNLGNSAGDFQDMIEDARFTVAGRLRRERKVLDGDPSTVSVEDSFKPEFAYKPIDIVATVHGRANAPYVLPKKMEFLCDQNWGDKCAKCGLSIYDGKRDVEIEEKDEIIVNMIDRSKEQVDKALKELVMIPPNCPKVEIHKDEVYTVEELLVMPSVETRSDEVVNPVDRTVYNIGSYNLQLNKTFRLKGTSMPHPRDQKSVFMAWDHEPVEVDIERFKMTPEIKAQLEIFQPDEWQDQTPWQKLKEIAYDMSINVTQIYGRPELHIGYDLVWHSVNSFYFSGNLQVRGWTECLVIGDTRTGKSEASHRLIDHYKSGVLMMADRASFAGLIGGASQKGASKNWGITWGAIPLNDKRLVVLDEAGGIKKEDISAMSSVRSQGVAEILKMGGQKTSARTRLVWIANPVTNRPIEEMANGAMDEIAEFIPTPEDIARFDFAMAAATDDVTTAQIDHERKTSTPHLHLAEDCKLLVTWCWSRKAEDVIWVDDTEEYIFKKTREFAGMYVAELPLVQKQSFHIKLARLSAAVAARLFSTDETGEKVLVRHEHVDTAIMFLDAIYGMDSFGYKRYSARIIQDTIRAKRNRQRAIDLMWDDDGVRNTLIRVMNHGRFKNRDFEERGGMAREQATIAADKLIDLGMLKPMSRGDLKMTSELLDILRDIRRDIDEELDREAMEEDG